MRTLKRNRKRTKMPPSVQQAAAIPIRDGLICMVTSRSGRRWVVPKGCIEPGHTPHEAARIEAWEEAGLVGTLKTEPIGSYHYEKYGMDHHVLVFLMWVSGEKADWPERTVRRREWVPVKTALERIEEPELQSLIGKMRHHENSNEFSLLET